MDRHWSSVVRGFMPNAMKANAMRSKKQSPSLKSAIGHHDMHGYFLSTLAGQWNEREEVA